MSIRSKQIGWSQESYLLHDILKELNKLRMANSRISWESDQAGITDDWYSPTFFGIGHTYLNLNVKNTGTGAITFSVGTTPGGNELLSDETVIPGQTGSFSINKVFYAVTPMYIWSADWNGAVIEIKTVSL